MELDKPTTNKQRCYVLLFESKPVTLFLQSFVCQRVARHINQSKLNISLQIGLFFNLDSVDQRQLTRINEPGVLKKKHLFILEEK